MALLAWHGSVEIARVAERAQGAVYRVNVVLDFRYAFVKLFSLVEQISPLCQKAVDRMAEIGCPRSGQVLEIHARIVVESGGWRWQNVGAFDT